MSVVWIREHFPQRSGTFETPLKSKSRRQWKALVDNKADDAHAIYNHGLSFAILPVYLDAHPNNLFHRARSIQINQESDTWKYWDITADYSSEPLEVTAEEEADTPPLDRSTKISWGSVQYEKAIVKDINDQAFLNSAGTPFASQLIDDARLVIGLRRNVAIVPTFLLDFQNVINNAVFTIQGVGFPAKTLKTQGFKVSEQKQEQGTSFYEIGMELHYRKETWVLSILDEGIYEVNGNDPPKPILDNDGNPIREPVPLASGIAIVPATPANAEYKDFDVYESKDFSILPF